MDAKTKKRYKRVRQTLLADLEARGLVEAVYTDKVEEYMELWENFQNFQKDLRDRGTMIEDEKRGMVENRSASLACQTSRQMLAIFTALGFKDVACDQSNRKAAEEDDDL